MEEKRLVPAKLNFLQQLRKSFYLIRMNEKNALKYTSLPDYLKLDNEVVDAVVTVRNSMIVNIPFENADSVLAKKPELIIHFMDTKIIEQHLIKHPELITYLEQDDRTSVQKFKELFLKENTYLTEEKHGIPFPNEGKTLIVKLKDNKTIPGSQY
jgi:hypothetical protein